MIVINHDTYDHVRMVDPPNEDSGHVRSKGARLPFEHLDLEKWATQRYNQSYIVSCPLGTRVTSGIDSGSSYSVAPEFDTGSCLNAYLLFVCVT